MKFIEVRRTSSSQLDLQSESGTVFVRGAAVIYDRQPGDGYVQYVVGSDRNQARAVFIGWDDGPSLAILDSLPRSSNPELVESLLQSGLREPSSMETVVGRMYVDDSVLTVLAGDTRQDFAMTSSKLPVVAVGDPQEDGSYSPRVHLPDGTRFKLLVASDHASDLLKASALLRASNPQIGGVQNASTNTTWEYRVVKNMTASRLEASLNDLGSSGWELVSIAGMDGVMTLTGNKIYAVLKRRSVRSR